MSTQILFLTKKVVEPKPIYRELDLVKIPC